MKEKPILFSGPMVRAILDGRKTQTRRVISDPRNLIQKIGGSGDADNDPDAFGYFAEGRDFAGWMVLARGVNERIGNNQDRCSIPCPYDADRLWVRETWRPVMERFRSFVEYDADGATKDAPPGLAMDFAKMALRFPGALKSRHSEAWHPSIHMPRWASRLTLAVESIRVERLQDITEEDARAEGCQDTRVRVVSCGDVPPNVMVLINGGAVVSNESTITVGRSARDNFHDLWQSINSKRPGCSWDDNPWVWAVTFSLVTP